MARVIDVQSLAGLSAGAGQVTIQLTDRDCEWNNGIYLLSSNGSQLSIKPSKDPECELTIQGLTALVYGVYDPQEFALRGWGNCNEDQQTALRQMFPPAIPFLHAMY
jgi:predicted acetyltransferase